MNLGFSLTKIFDLDDFCLGLVSVFGLRQFWSPPLVTSLKALLANLRGKERGRVNENASKLVYFAPVRILTGFLRQKSIFIIFLAFKLILEYFLNIKNTKIKQKLTSKTIWAFGFGARMQAVDGLCG